MFIGCLPIASWFELTRCDFPPVLPPSLPPSPPFPPSFVFRVYSSFRPSFFPLVQLSLAVNLFSGEGIVGNVVRNAVTSMASPMQPAPEVGKERMRGCSFSPNAQNNQVTNTSKLIGDSRHLNSYLITPIYFVSLGLEIGVWQFSFYSSTMHGVSNASSARGDQLRLN